MSGEFSRPSYAPGMLNFWSEVLLAFYDRLELRPPLRLLDVGCGGGVLVRRAAAHGMTAYGVEPYWPISSPGIVRALAERLPFADASFDVVTSFSVFEYIERPAHAAAEMARVLRSGGRAYVAVPEFAGYRLMRPRARNGTSRGWFEAIIGPEWRTLAVESFGLKYSVPLLKRARSISLLRLLYWHRYPPALSDISVFHLQRC